MTKKALVLALVAALAYCAPASANVLPLRTAKQLAKRLAAKQVRTRAIVSLHIAKGRRISPREIRFAYDDRSNLNVFCTSLIVVKLPKPTSTRAVATFDNRANVCRGVPDDALAFEAATRNAERTVSGQAAAVTRSVNTLKQSSVPCKRLHVPKNRRAQVALMTDIAATSAAYDPIDSQLQSFVNSLGATRSTDSTLVAGAAAWADLLQVFRSLPAFHPSLCGVVKRWAAAGWAASAAPANFTALAALDRRAAADSKVIAKASAHLAQLGVFPRTAVAFTPDGLLGLGVGQGLRK